MTLLGYHARVFHALADVIQYNSKFIPAQAPMLFESRTHCFERLSNFLSKCRVYAVVYRYVLELSMSRYSTGRHRFRFGPAAVSWQRSRKQARFGVLSVSTGEKCQARK